MSKENSEFRINTYIIPISIKNRETPEKRFIKRLRTNTYEKYAAICAGTEENSHNEYDVNGSIAHCIDIDKRTLALLCFCKDKWNEFEEESFEMIMMQLKNMLSSAIPVTMIVKKTKKWKMLKPIFNKYLGEKNITIKYI